MAGPSVEAQLTATLISTLNAMECLHSANTQNLLFFNKTLPEQFQKVGGELAAPIRLLYMINTLLPNILGS